MKLVMTLLVRDEADIVQANIEYHLAQGVDFVIVTDHGSRDGTSEILREYERMEVAKVIRDEGVGHHQSRRVTRMAEIARLGHGADWVINNDADEFWWPLVGTLREVFTAVPARFRHLEVQRHNFRPLPGEEDPFHARLVVREAVSLGVTGQSLGPKVAHRPRPGVVVAPGNHSLVGSELPGISAEGMLQIFHFPMRSYEQFERKVIQTGIGYEQVEDRSPGVGHDQLALLEIQRAGGLREFYAARTVEGEPLQRALEMGTLEVDRRLEVFMRALGAGERLHTPPQAASERALVRRTLDGLDELALLREQLDALQRENAAALRLKEELERAHAQEIERLRSRHASQLHELRHQLHLIRTSRLMRSTAWARRIYYRARRRS